MKEKILEQAEQLLGGQTKLSELKAKGLGFDPTVGSWALAWSHYALAGDARVVPTLDPDGKMDIKGTKIGPESTVSELMSVLKK